MPTPPITRDHPKWNIYQQAYEMKAGGMTVSEIAAEIDVAEGSVAGMVRRAKHVIESGQGDAAIADAMRAVNTQMTPTLAWAKTKNEDGTSYSVLLKPVKDDAATLADIAELFSTVKPAKPVAPPKATLDDYCTVYPLMDVHLGMLAWGRETGGADYDLNLASEDMHHAFAKLDALTPKSAQAILVIGGDFFHADDNTAQTPAHRHNLDVDGRHWKVLESGVRLIASIIHRLLQKHQNVIVRVLRGNHDEHAHMVLTFALFERYRDDPRVEVERNPRDIFMRQWGKCLLAAHHGDKARPERLVLMMAEICPFWSDTRHRYIYTGHVHHDRALDVAGMKWESLRAFCPPDSYAAGMGFAPRRAMQTLTFHKQDGLVLRALDPIERTP